MIKRIKKEYYHLQSVLFSFLHQNDSKMRQTALTLQLKACLSKTTKRKCGIFAICGY